MRFDVITLFPEAFDVVCKFGITARALENRLYNIVLWNPRDFTTDQRKTVDDRPFGGGPGMVMMAEPLQKTISAVKAESDSTSWVIHFSPQGTPLNHQKVMELAAKKNLILLASRYEGVDERLIKHHVDEEISLGDYVLSGGEIPAMALIDAIVRQLPGSLGDSDSAAQDSFVNGLLDCPHYTRPEVIENETVPAVLLSGHHEEIRRWRLKQALARTRAKRPDLLAARQLTKEESRLLAEIEQEQGSYN
jgi:tRNA (guanine37-N1)-methyltransferase